MAITAKPGTTAGAVLVLAQKGYSTKEIGVELQAQGIKTTAVWIEQVLRGFGLIGKQNKLEHRVEAIESMVYDIWVIARQLTGMSEGEIERRVKMLKDRNDEEFYKRVTAVNVQRIEEQAQRMKEAAIERGKRRRIGKSHKESRKRRAGDERHALDLLQKLAGDLAAIPKPEFVKTLSPRPPRGPRAPEPIATSPSAEL